MARAAIHTDGNGGCTGTFIHRVAGIAKAYGVAGAAAICGEGCAIAENLHISGSGRAVTRSHIPLVLAISDEAVPDCRRTGAGSNIRLLCNDLEGAA